VRQEQHVGLGQLVLADSLRIPTKAATYSNRIAATIPI
jgi:hypothetical protein